ncbi:MAG: hypothetical protein HYT10_03060 [Candidatus Levybacteria bacterium]|nr:hypothetical protein [Candidatus Levybacteria bacterium]
MSAEHDDIKRALDEVSDILEETQLREAEIPLDVAYWVGMALITTSPKDKDDTDRQQIASSIVSRLEKVVPEGLIEKGPNDFSGDLSTIVPVALSQRDMEHIGQAVLSLPSGRQIIRALPIDPSDRAELDGYRNRQLRAFLTLSSMFSEVGGKVNPQIRAAVEQELS